MEQLAVTFDINLQALGCYPRVPPAAGHPFDPDEMPDLGAAGHSGADGEGIGASDEGDDNPDDDIDL